MGALNGVTRDPCGAASIVSQCIDHVGTYSCVCAPGHYPTYVATTLNRSTQTPALDGFGNAFAQS